MGSDGMIYSKKSFSILLWAFFLLPLALTWAKTHETIHNSGSSDNRLDLVFIGDRYFADEMVDYEKDVETIWSGMQSNYAFWNRYKNFVNVHII
jgi:hypothetical protein